MKQMAFISQQFFSLEKYMMKGFQDQGWDVSYFDERKSNSKVNKILLRSYPGLLAKRMDRYYEEIYQEIIDSEITFVFIVKAENVPVWFLDKLRNHSKKIRTVLYLYDPIKNYQGILEKADHFSSTFTFDSEDARKYNWNHRPLFYPPITEQLDKNLEIKYSGSFVGTLHTDRAKVIKRIKDQLPESVKERLLLYYYIPLGLMFWVGKLITKDYSYLSRSDVSTHALSSEETLTVMQQSDFIIDMHHDNQSGLTTRTMEALGMNKKILTTNPYIKNYDFYCPNNIYVVDKYNPVIDANWFNLKYDDKIEYNRDYYSISGFVSDITDKGLGGN